MKKKFEIDIRDPRSRDFYSRFKISRTPSRFRVSRSLINLEVIQQSRDKSRKTVSRCKYLGLKISAQTIGSFDSDRIRRLEIKVLEIYERSRDFANSRFIFNLETFCIFKIPFNQIEMGKSRDFKISKLNLEILIRDFEH